MTVDSDGAVVDLHGQSTVWEHGQFSVRAGCTGYLHPTTKQTLCYSLDLLAKPASRSAVLDYRSGQVR